MSVKSPVLLLLLSMIVTQVTACEEELQHHMCDPDTQPINCTNNPRIRVDKSEETYQLIILCASNQCTENITINFECCDICEACEILTG